MSHAEIEAVLQLTIKDIEEKRSQTKSFLPKVCACMILLYSNYLLMAVIAG